MHSSSNYGEAARSQLEMEEQCQDAPRATYFRAGLRVVRTTAWSHAASRRAAGSRGRPPRPVVLCRLCHRIADSGSVAKVWYWRLKLATRHFRRLLRLLRLGVV